MFKHIKILKLAQQEARYILGEDNNLQLKENMALKKEIIDKFKDTLKEISLN
nr:hypothetical protein [Clostridioides difficile]